MSAVLTAVASATATVPRLYELGKVPASPSYAYGTYSAALGRGSAYLLDSEARARLGRVTVQTFAHTESAALDHMELVEAVLLDHRLAITGWRCEPLRAQLDSPAIVRDPDDQTVIGVTQTWTFTAAKEI